MNIAIGFFGITRSLSYTIESIRENIFRPARKVGKINIYCHFYRQSVVENSRSGESGFFDPEEYKLLEPDDIEFEVPGSCLAKWQYETIASYGDNWNDGFVSIKNLIHQLNSLHAVTIMIDRNNPDLILFCRPDLLYHDSFSRILNPSSIRNLRGVSLPGWQWFGGLNDRFAICDPNSFRAYGNRIEMCESFLRKTRSPIHSERLLRFALEHDNVP